MEPGLASQEDRVDPPITPQREEQHTKQLFGVIMLWLRIAEELLRGWLCRSGRGSNGICRAQAYAIGLIMLLPACAGRQVELPHVRLPAPKR